MRFKLHSVVAIIWALCQVVSASAGDVSPITKMELRQLPPGAVTQRVLDQLSNILHLEQYPATGEKPRLPLSDLWFWTTAHATNLPDLCATDEVTIYFRPANATLDGADTKTVAESISANAHYHLLRNPVTPRPSALDEVARSHANADCASLDPSKIKTFTALDENDAVESVWLVTQAIRLSRDPKMVKLIDCKRFPETKDGCASVVQKASIEHIDSIDRCEGDNFSMECREVYLLSEGLSLRIFAQDERGGLVIVRVEPAELVTIGDQRAD